MNTNKSALHSKVVDNLKAISDLKNSLLNKEIEKQDNLKEFALQVIDVLDSFERIEEGLQEKGIQDSSDGATAMSRYKIIQKKLVSVLNKHGVTKIEFPENRLIVGVCEVVDVETDSNRNNEEIIEVVRNGYMRGKFLIRPAQVIVVKN